MRIRARNCPNCGAPLPPQGPCTSCGAIVRDTQTGSDTCPNCGAPLNANGDCTSCGATMRGFYQGLDLGRIDIARAVEQGLDYYLLLGLPAESSDSTIQAAYQRIRLQLPADRSRLLPQAARRLQLVEQAAYVLCNPQRRQIYDHLRQTRLARVAASADEATRGMNCFRTSHFDDAARLLRSATRREPDNVSVHINYCLSLLYGSKQLASPEDWRVNEMLDALKRAAQAEPENASVRSYFTLCQAIDHYDKGRFEKAWAMMARLNQSMPTWHLPWIVSAYWRRREGKFGEMLARAERARRLSSDDYLVTHLLTLLRQTWATAPALLPDAARQAVALLADGTAANSLESAWR